MAGMVPVKSATEVVDEMRTEAEKTEDALNGTTASPVVIENLSSYIDKLWTRAQDAKRPIEDRMLKCLRARNGEYEPDKLAAMQTMFGSNYQPVFMHITETKCRTAESWITETIFQTGKRPYSLEPTPIPELPPSLMEKVRQESMMALVQRASQEASMTGGQPSMFAIMEVLQDALPEINEAVMKSIREIAKESATLMEDKIQDQFVEGGWYQSLQRAIYDFVTYPAMIMKGPCLRRSPVRIREFNEQTMAWDDRIEERIIPVWERRSPFNIYPSPDATADDIPWIFDKITLTRKALSDLIGVTDYDDEAIRAVLKQYRDGQLRDWLSIDTEKIAAEGKPASTMTDSEGIDCLEFHGTVPGSLLREWGLSSADVPDGEREYDAIVWKIGKHVIKAMLNKDPMRKKYFYRSAFAENPESFWGRGVPELIEHIQTLANASARAISHNLSISAGPQCILNTDCLAPGENEAIYPWKVWRVTSGQLMEGKPVEFYQPNIVTARLIEIYNFCMALADEDSGVPRYMQGNAAGVSGAGETASGLNMLMSHAAKGVRSAIRNIDIGIISPSVESCYFYNMEYEKDLDIVGDLRVVARGSSALVAKEQLAIRRTEFLNTTINPIDAQIIGPAGRRELLKESIRSLELDPEKILGDDDAAENEMPQAPPAEVAPNSAMGGSPKAAPKSLGPDGSPVAGRDNQQFESQSGVTP